MEKIMETVLKQLKKMTFLIAMMTSNLSANTKTLTDDKKCPICKRKKHPGGETNRLVDPKNADTRPLWYKEHKAKKEAEKKYKKD